MHRLKHFRLFKNVKNASLNKKEDNKREKKEERVLKKRKLIDLKKRRL